MSDRVTVIEPRRGWISIGLSEVWEYRELLFALAGREIRIRYKQTLLGAAWAIVQPLAVAVLFGIFFGHFAGMPSDGLPYPLYVLAGMVPWTYFVFALGGASSSLVDHRAILTKVYFPRLVLPAAAPLAGLLDLALGMLVLGGMMVNYGVLPGAAVWTLPFFVALTGLTSISVGLWLSALNAHYRDFRHAIPFLLQFWFFATPVAYSLGIVPERWHLVYALNPMVSVVEGFRWALLGTPRSPFPFAWISLALVLVLFVSGIAVFRRLERTMVDVV